MDDPARTRKTLDDLADLFLTGTSSRSSSQAGLATAGQAAKISLPFKDDRDATNGDELDAPQPVPLFPYDRRRPSARRAASAVRATPSDASSVWLPPDPRSHGRALLPGGGAPGQRSDVVRGRVEAVFLGNLPGFSGPWLIQYASYLARQYGPVGIVSVDGDQVEIELVGPQQRALDELATAAVGSELQRATFVDVLERLAEADTAPVKTWLIHLPTPMTPQTCAWAVQLDRWTLLCGCDDAAVVGAYRLLKQLHATCAATGGGESDPRVDCQVGVMIMGGDDVAGRNAVTKLDQAAGRFLNTRVQWVGSQKQMQPVNRRSLGSFYGHGQDTWWQVMCFLRSLEHETLRGGVDEPAQVVTQQADCIGPGSESGGGRGQRDDLSGVNGPQIAPQSAGDSPQSSDQFRPGRLPDTQMNLASFLMQDDIVILQATCPRVRQVQLVLDSDGRLHLIARHTGYAAEESISGQSFQNDLRKAVMDLMEVSHWARQHIELLQITQPQRRIDVRGHPVLHLFTDQVKTAVRLVGGFGQSVKFHVLQKMDGNDSNSWFSTELN